MKDYKIAYPEPLEVLTIQFLMFANGDFHPIRFECFAKDIVQSLVLFNPIVTYNNEYFYRYEFAFFLHQN